MAKSEKLFAPEWFPYYFERFQDSDKVALMSLAEEGAYHRAIRITWKYGTVPSDPEILAAKIGKRCTPKVAAVVLSTFEPVPSDPKRAFHPIVEEIRIEQELLHLAKVRGGEASGRARKQKTSSTTEQRSNGVRAQPRQIKNQIQIQNQTDFKRLIERAVSDFPQIDAKTVEVGVLYTLLQRNGSEEPIRSIKYFEPEILKAVKPCKQMGGKAMEVLLVTRRRKVYEMNGWEYGD